MRSKFIAVALLLAGLAPAHAQWNTMPQYNVGASRGPSVTTPQAIAPGATVGRPLVSQGAAAYPAFSATLAGITSINGVSVPSAGSFFATTTGTETLTNKSMSGSANTFTNIGNAALINSATTVNGQSCTLGSSCTVQVPISTGVTGLGTGVATALGINPGTAGSVVINGGALGTPSSGNLVNATGLPIGGVSGLGAGVATALGIAPGTPGSFVVNGGALGTPSSGTLTNATGLPLATGITGFGTGIAAILAINQFSAGAVIQRVGSGTVALGTSAISSGSCAAAVTVAASGVASNDILDASFNGDPTAVTGYTPSVSGMLTIIAYPTTNNVNFKVCNLTASSITPGAITLNWAVRR